MCRRQSPDPPEWWSLDLYNDLEGMPFEGWVWEFMRRDRLQELLNDVPVEAMNPSPDLRDISPDYWNYLKHWKHDSWQETDGSRKKMPFWIPPSVTIPGQWPLNFHGQQYGTDNPTHMHNINITVDISRRNTTIRKDFKLVLQHLRQEYPLPKRINPRYETNILAVWDLRQFLVPWNRIVSEIFDGYSNRMHSARNAYYSAKKLIDEHGWQELARFITP